MDYLKVIKNNSELAEKLDELCDFFLHDEFTELDKDYEYSKVKFQVFGADASGGSFGYIGEGDVSSLPIGYSSSEGQSGKIAENVSDFFHLIVFCPFWHDILTIDRLNDKNYAVKTENEHKSHYENYDEMQNFACGQLGLKKTPDILEKLYKALTSEPKFVVYSSVDDNPSEDLLSVY